MRRKPRTGPGTRGDTGQNGHTKRVPCAFGVFSTITAQPGLQIRYITCGCGITTFNFRAGFAAGRTRLEARAARREVLRVVRVALIFLLSITRRAGIIYSVLRYFWFLLQTKSLWLPPLDNQPVGRLALARLRAQSRKAPRRLRMVALDSAFTAAVRVIDRVHSHAAVRWPPPMPARAPCLAVRDVFMIQIAKLADSRHAVQREFPRFARWQLDERDVALFAEQLSGAPRRTHQLSALAGRKLEVVHHRAGRNIANRQSVAGQNVRRGSVLHRHADFKAHRMQNVALFAVRVMQQDDSGRTIRVVFDGGNLRRDSSLFAPKINQAVIFLVAAARAFLRLDERLLRLLLRDLALVEHGQEAPRRCVRSECF